MPVHIAYKSNKVSFSMMFPRGFSVNLVYLIWALFGGVLLHAFHSLVLKMTFMPVWSEPINTAQQILDRGLVPTLIWPNELVIDKLQSSPYPTEQKLAKKMVMDLDGWSDEGVGYNRMLECSNADCNFAFLSQLIWPPEAFHESKEVLSGDDGWAVFITNKKWPLNQELATHILHHQQVNTT